MLIVGEDGPWLIPNSLGGDTFTPDPSPDTSDNTSVRALQHRIGENDRIIGKNDKVLIVKKKWLDLIFAKIKQLEIRPYPGVKGKRIFLCESGTSRVFGAARVDDSLGPLDDDDWVRLRDQHRVPGEKLYTRNFAWQLSNVERWSRSVQIRRKPGSIGDQNGPGW